MSMSFKEPGQDGSDTDKYPLPTKPVPVTQARPVGSSDVVRVSAPSTTGPSLLPDSSRTLPDTRVSVPATTGPSLLPDSSRTLPDTRVSVPATTGPRLLLPDSAQTLPEVPTPVKSANTTVPKNPTTTTVGLTTVAPAGPAPGPVQTRPLVTAPATAPVVNAPAETEDGQPLPTELQKRMHPAYVIEPPDILYIDAIRIVPRPPYRIEALDILLIQVAEALPNQPIAGPFSVGPDGTVNLGYSYGTVRIAGLTLEQAAVIIRNQLSRVLRDPQVAVALAQFRGVQQTRGEHLVGQDGTITLGTYGCVNVTGLTLHQAKLAIERHLSRFLLNPEISLSVAAYNSKVYYVVIDGGGFGQQVFRFPITGNETVLDAISQINGLPPIASTKKMWLARPAPAGHGCYQMLPIDWHAVVQAADPTTNYQVFPGDRIYVKANCLLAINNYLGQFLAPIEQAFGVTLLGAGTIGTVRSVGSNNFNNNNGF
jgi:polysaccharide export outer membrane protein